MTTLSIIIPIYNVEKYLSQCLQSILEQDCEDIEIIMVEDHSTDRSLEIAKKFNEKFNKSKLIINKFNCGLGPARNSALDVAIGKYIMMIDSDDWITNESISIIINTINLRSFDIAQFGCNKIYTDKVESNLYIHFTTEPITTLDKKHILLGLPNYAWLKIVRRQFIIENNVKFHNIYYEDIPWSINLTILAKSIELIPVSFYNYRQRSGSIISTQSSKHLDLLHAYGFVYNDLIPSTVGFTLKVTINNAFITAAYYLYLQRQSRLGSKNLEQFSRLYINILKKNQIFPTTFRTLVMIVITISKIFISKIFEGAHTNKKSK